MADYQPNGEPAVPVLDLSFDSGTLGVVRAGIMTHARQAGLSAARVADVVLAVHELAANAVRHGAGKGRLRVRKWVRALQCQVDDGDPAAAFDQTPARQFPIRPGHGLWVVRQLADRMQILSGAHGTRATVVFDLPAPGRPKRQAGSPCCQVTAPERPGRLR